MISIAKKASLRVPCRSITTQATNLIVNPLEIENTHIIRESSTTFAKPNFVSFDLFGTLYQPKRPILQQYHDIAQKFGVETSISSIEERFPRIYDHLFQEYPNYGKLTPQFLSSEDWWKQLIVEVLEIEDFRRSAKSNELCDNLMDHFTTTEAYELYDDVVPTLKELKSQGIRLIASSNSDERVGALLDNLGIGSYFDNVYNSYDIGYMKPLRQFFMQILKHYHPMNNRLPEYLENCWHVGDSYQQDFLGSVKSGWNGILVDRTRSSEFFVAKDKLQAQNDQGCFMSTGTSKKDDDMLVIANNRIVIATLAQLQKLYE